LVKAGKFFPGQHFELRLNDTDWEKVGADFMPTPEQQAVGRVSVPRGVFYMKQECAVAYCAKHRLTKKEATHGR
jgi:hypothetical protein